MFASERKDNDRLAPAAVADEEGLGEAEVDITCIPDEWFDNSPKICCIFGRNVFIIEICSLLRILGNLTVKELCDASRVSSLWQNLTTDDSLVPITGRILVVTVLTNNSGVRCIYLDGK